MLTVLANMLNALTCGALFTFLPLLLLSKGFSPSTLGVFGLGFSIGCFMGKIICGRLIDKYGSSTAFISSHAILSILLYFLIVNNHLNYVIFLSFTIGIVTKGSIPIVQTIATEFIPKSKYNDIFSINTFFRGIVMIITPLSFGLIAELFGIKSVFFIMSICSIVSIFPILLVNYFKKQLS
jgi:MFS family permease